MGVLSSKGKANIEPYATLNSYFDKLANKGLLIATGLVQEETGLTTRNDGTDNVVFSPHISKH